MNDDDLDRRVMRAVNSFWRTRDRQAESQGARTGNRDTGQRTAVTGGKHLSGFVELCRDLLLEAGLQRTEVFVNQRLELPGYFRAEKNWDLIAICEGQLVAAIEFKAQVGPSFGNNFNNRTEEAIGNATDLWTAYREGAFHTSCRPCLGYVFILEDCDRSQSPVRVKSPHFGVFPEIQNASYAQRYELLLNKLMRERLYDGTCLLLTRKPSQRLSSVASPPDLGFRVFAAGLQAHVSARLTLLNLNRDREATE